MHYEVTKIVEKYLKSGQFSRPFEPIPNWMTVIDEDETPKGQQSLSNYYPDIPGIRKIPATGEWFEKESEKIESFIVTTYNDTVESLCHKLTSNPTDAEKLSVERLTKLRQELKTHDDKMAERGSQKYSDFGRYAQYLMMPQLLDEYANLN